MRDLHVTSLMIMSPCRHYLSTGTVNLYRITVPCREAPTSQPDTATQEDMRAASRGTDTGTMVAGSPVVA